jgi:hypothetical protein
MHAHSVACNSSFALSVVRRSVERLIATACIDGCAVLLADRLHRQNRR